MTETRERMVDKTVQPDGDTVSRWIGPEYFKRWQNLVKHIEDTYPGVFPPDEWLDAGKKHGWRLLFKKSKSFCTLIPERNRFTIQIVLGREKREKTEPVLPELQLYIRDIYASATTYHDGKWLFVIPDSDEIIEDVKRLLAIKRPPKKKK